MDGYNNKIQVFRSASSSKLAHVKKKLRDVLQEREGTSLNYFKLFPNYIEQNSRSILLQLGLLWTILVYLGASWSILFYLGLSWAILSFLELSWTILDYLGLSWAK